ncbi:hypothetical protein FACS189443_3020 [Planctomycetales bacterium]|nr:hypothetical protein FACS189443_3020 [Planctomycetales bacterium]
MNQLTRIPPSEWGVMEVLWNEAPLSAAEIGERLPPESDWNVKAVRAFLDRLIRKNAVSRRKTHGIYVFEPLIKRSDSLRQESRSFLDRFFQGNPMSMISHFVENEQLTSKDIERLKTIIKSKDTNNTNK